jgi:hypothetical protein
VSDASVNAWLSDDVSVLYVASAIDGIRLNFSLESHSSRVRTH